MAPKRSTINPLQKSTQFSPKKNIGRTPAIISSSAPPRSFTLPQITWVLMALLVVIASFALFFSMNGSGLTGAAVVQNIAFVKEGSAIPISLLNIDGGFLATFTFSETVKEEQVRITENDLPPRGGKFISAFTVETDAPVQRIVFEFRVDKKQLQLLSLSKEELSLYKDSTKLPTTRTKEQDDFVFYTATSSTAGQFYLGKFDEENAGEVSGSWGSPTSREEQTANAGFLPAESTTEALVGEAAEQEVTEQQPAPVPEEPVQLNFWMKIKGFFQIFLWD